MMSKGNKVPHCIKNANGDFAKNKIGGLTGRKKWLLIDNKKWVFTVHLARFFFTAKISYRYFLPFSAGLIKRRVWNILYLTSTFSS